MLRGVASDFTSFDDGDLLEVLRLVACNLITRLLDQVTNTKLTHCKKTGKGTSLGLAGVFLMYGNTLRAFGLLLNFLDKLFERQVLLLVEAFVEAMHLHLFLCVHSSQSKLGSLVAHEAIRQ